VNNSKDFRAKVETENFTRHFNPRSKSMMLLILSTETDFMGNKFNSNDISEGTLWMIEVQSPVHALLTVQSVLSYKGGLD
jgi:hypothetical protein